MKKLFLLFLLVTLCGCGNDDTAAPEPTPEPPAPPEEPTYWNTQNVRRGLQVRGREPAIWLGDQKFFSTGVNCYDLFLISVTLDGQNASFDTEPSFETLRVLKRNGVRVVRFNCGMFYAKDLHAYFNHKAEYIKALVRIATYAEKLEIGLLPSIFWCYDMPPKYYGEGFRAWGRPESQTVAFLKSYTQEVVTALAPYKSIFGWEFGNELNLQIDLPNWEAIFGTKDPNNWFRGADLNFAMRTFAQVVEANDPDGRLISSGYANLRTSQYNQYAHNSWATDTKEQYKQITSDLTPTGVQVSEHIYTFSRPYADLGEVQLPEWLRIAKSTATELGRVYILGEFGGADQAEYQRFYTNIYDAKIQLSFVWNFALNGNIEYSFTEQSEKGQYLFEMLRTCNLRFDREL